jgi:ABC-type cobalamin/Fe3+-siderophores transport system ATPase subunit
MTRTKDYRFGDAETVITEEGLQYAFGIESRIIRHEDDYGNASMGVLPILKPYRRGN